MKIKIEKNVSLIVRKQSLVTPARCTPIGASKIQKPKRIEPRF